MPPILLIDVLQDLFAPLVLKINVDIGWLMALLGDEALQQQIHSRGVDFCYAQRVADCRVGGTAASLAEDSLLACEVDDFLHGQEVVLVLQVTDEFEFVLDLCLHLGRDALRLDMKRQELTRQIFKWNLTSVTGSKAECLHVVSNLFHFGKREFATPSDFSGRRVILPVKGWFPNYFWRLRYSLDAALPLTG